MNAGALYLFVVAAQPTRHWRQTEDIQTFFEKTKRMLPNQMRASSMVALSTMALSWLSFALPVTTFTLDMGDNNVVLSMSKTLESKT